jgi:hypothetical protein
MDLIVKIADRAAVKNSERGWKQAIIMDLNATHCNGCRLDLDRLLAAEDFDFTHDVYGIRRHLNRNTGKLEGFFVPRLAERY